MERLIMRKIREVLRLTDSGRSTRQVAAALGISGGAVAGYLQRARAADMTWARASTMTWCKSRRPGKNCVSSAQPTGDSPSDG